MLAYAFQFLKEDGTTHVNTEEFDHVEDLCAGLLALGMSKQVKRGLAKEYVVHSELLSSARGRIDVSASVKERALFKKQLVCEVDEYTENTRLNQIIKSTLLLLIKSNQVKLKHKKELKRLMNHIQHVDGIDLSSVAWHTVRYQRHNANYRMLIHICQLVVQGLIPSSSAGEERHLQVVDHQYLSRLYEKFVFAYYQKHYPELRASASHIPWQAEGENVWFLPTMKSDVMLHKGDRTLIIDTKYYRHSMQHQPRYNSSTLHSSHLYQIYTYVKNKDKNQSGLVSGVLLYAKTNEELTPDQKLILEGNVIRVQTLDLNTDFSVIQQQLDAIVQRF